MLIHEIPTEQTVLSEDDLIEIEDGLTGESKKMLMSLITPALGLANQQLFINAAADGKEFGYGSKVVAYTRDMTLAGGDVSYTGAGFKPRTIIVLALYTASFVVGIGINNSNWTFVLYGTSLGTTYFGSVSLFQLAEDEAHTKYQQAVLKSLDADGCTLTWTKNGFPTDGNGNFVILYLR